VVDSADAYPFDGSESSDADGDGIGDNADLDDEGDGWSDHDESQCGTGSKDPSDVPQDSDGDGICDSLDVVVDPAEGGLPGFGLISALAALALAALARRD